MEATTDQVDDMKFVASNTPSPEQKALECDEVLRPVPQRAVLARSNYQAPCLICKDVIRVSTSARYQCQHCVCMRCSLDRHKCPVVGCGKQRGWIAHRCVKCGATKCATTACSSCRRRYCDMCNPGHKKCKECRHNRPIGIAPPTQPASPSPSPVPPKTPVVDSVAERPPVWPPVILCDIVLRQPQMCPICGSGAVYTMAQGIKAHLTEFHRYPLVAVRPFFRVSQW